MCDRNTQERVALQKGFVDYVIGPYYKLVAGEAIFSRLLIALR